MRTAGLALTTALGLASVACGATARSADTTFGTPVTVTTATVTFMTRDDGKDEDSAVAVQLLDEDGRLAAEATVANVEFDDRTVSMPLNLALSRALSSRDIDDARVRLRLTPDGRDTWMFDMRANLQLSDGTERQYFWSGLQLDESAPERTMTLASGRMR